MTDRSGHVLPLFPRHDEESVACPHCGFVGISDNFDVIVGTDSDIADSDGYGGLFCNQCGKSFVEATK